MTKVQKNSRKINTTVSIESVQTSAKDRIYNKLLQSLDCEAIHEKVFLNLFKKHSPYRIYQALDSCMYFSEPITKPILRALDTISVIKNYWLL